MATNVYDSKHVIDFGIDPCEYYGFYVSTTSTSIHAENSKKEEIDDLISRVEIAMPASTRRDVHFIAGLAYVHYHCNEEWEKELAREELEKEVPNHTDLYKIMDIPREIEE